MTRETIIKSLAIGGMFVVAGVIALNSDWTSSAHADSPDGTAWVCTDPECDHGFIKTISELGQFYRENPGGDMPCPKCSATPAVRAFRCPACDKFFAPAQQRGAPICPACKHDFRTQVPE